LIVLGTVAAAAVVAGSFGSADWLEVIVTSGFVANVSFK